MDIAPELPDADVLSTTGAACLFCFVAAGSSAAYQNEVTASGYFTDTLIRKLSENPSHTYDCVQLAHDVSGDLLKNRLPVPRFYLIGNHAGSILPDPIFEAPSSRSVPSVRRPKALQSLFETVSNSDWCPVWMFGPPNIGKSTLLRQFDPREHFSIYMSLPEQLRGVASVLEFIAGECAAKCVEISASGRPLLGPPDATIQALSDRRPGAILIIDHVERLEDNDIRGFLLFITKYPLLIWIFSSRHEAPYGARVRHWRCPILSEQEINLFIEQFGNVNSLSNSDIMRASGGIPATVRRLLANRSVISEYALTESARRCASALVETGGYINEVLFREVTGCAKSELDDLFKFGYVTFSDGHYLPHDSLASDAKLSGPRNGIISCEYWARQVVQTPHDDWACAMLAGQLLKYESNEVDETAFRLMIDSLVRTRQWSIVENVAEMLSGKTTGSDLLLSIADRAVHVTKYRVVDKALTILGNNTLTPSQSLHRSLILSERAFWFGDYQQASDLAKAVLQTGNAPDLLLSRAHLSVAIAAFFNGSWRKCFKHLAESAGSADNDPRLVGWIRLMAGSIVGLLGLDYDKGVNSLESATRLLTSSDDWSGVASAWNNLGEINWKFKEYRTSIIQLNRAFAFAEQIDDWSTMLESARNIVHAQLRSGGILSDEFQQAFGVLTEQMSRVPDPTEQMQVWNTIATVYAYRGDATGLASCLEKAELYTRGNSEYHIYTLGNRCLLQFIRGEPSIAYETGIEAVRLAADGLNRLAILQIIGDLEYVSARISVPSKQAMGDLIRTAGKIIDASDGKEWLTKLLPQDDVQALFPG